MQSEKHQTHKLTGEPLCHDPSFGQDHELVLHEEVKTTAKEASSRMPNSLYLSKVGTDSIPGPLFARSEAYLNSAVKVE